MHAITLNRFGTPDVLEGVKLPKPTPGPGQVLVHNKAIGVNFRDTWVRAGAAPPPPGTSLPLVLGSEIGGIVAEIGEGVDPAVHGRRVVTGTGGTGGYAEYSLAPASAVVPVPDAVDITDATALYVNGRVALGAFRAARIAEDSTVMILGASGGIGTLLVQLAVQAGVSTVIGANRTGDRARLSARYGVTDSLGYDQCDFDSHLHHLAPEGIDVVFDGVGGRAAQIAVDHLRTGTGRVVTYGYASGVPLPVSSADLIPRGVSVLGVGGQARLPGVATSLATEAVELLAAGVLSPVIGQRFPLSAAPAAHRAIEERTTLGKTLLHPDTEHADGSSVDE